MLSSGFKAERLRVNLRLAINRLKLLEKKKTELAQKARKEIADYLSTGKDERARIRVEHIIREDYLVEAMEILELYCDLLLARFGLIHSMKEMDPGLAEAISTLIWAAPRLQTEVSELKTVASQLCNKYSKEYGNLCRTNQIGTVSQRCSTIFLRILYLHNGTDARFYGAEGVNNLMHKLSVETPPRILVERYLIEIAKNYNIQYEPDSVVMAEGPFGLQVDPSCIGFIDDTKKGGPGGGGGGGAGGGDFRNAPFSYSDPKNPESFPNAALGIYEPCTFLQPPPRGNMPPHIPNTLPAYDMAAPSGGDSRVCPAQDFGHAAKPKATAWHGSHGEGKYDNQPLPKLPSVPGIPPTTYPHADLSPYEDIDFEDLSKRLDDLKKKT